MTHQVEREVAVYPTSDATKPASNTIGALRLILASLVIFSHSPEMLDGDLHRDPFYRIFHTLSFGSLAVDVFFLISGYLIAASFVSSRSVGDYFLKRILRIYPAFVVCSLVCIFIVAPLAGAKLDMIGAAAWGRLTYRILMLKSPEVAGVFNGFPFPVLNGSAWTISYEFRCYILAALFGIMDLYRRPKIFLMLSGVVLCANLVLGARWAGTLHVAPWIDAVFGDPPRDVRLLAAFMTGTCFWLCRESLAFQARWAAPAAVLLIVLLCIPLLAESALFLLGGYVLFWVAFNVRWEPLLALNSKDDVSYGVYLYAWPVGCLLIWYWNTIPLLALDAFTLGGAVLCGFASWFLVERPAMRWKRRLGRDTSATSKARHIPGDRLPAKAIEPQA
jgi:peptidoglycan/LPS O-acetylase OafA/YrhL